MYNILLGGAAGDGIDTMSALLDKTLKRAGFFVFSHRDFMSRIRGGHNFAQTRFGPQPVAAHRDRLDGIYAVDETTWQAHKARLAGTGFVLCDETLAIDDARAVKLPLAAIAKRAGNPRAATSAAIGALLALFGIPAEHADAVLASTLRGELAGPNQQALAEGYRLVRPKFPAERGSTPGTVLLGGSAAVALGALAGGLRFYSAYPMSPSTAILEYLQKHGEALGVAVEQAEDEIAAANMALGASFAGARAMTGTSGGGFSLMVEALGFAGIAEIPVVFVDAQRPGPATGFPTRTEQADLKFVINASQGEFPRMVIAAKNHADAFYQTARALALAEKYQMPVIVLSDQYLADSTSVVPAPQAADVYRYTPPGEDAVVPDQNGVYRRYLLTEDGVSPRLIPGKTEHQVRADSDEHDEYSMITESADVRTRMVDKRAAKLRGLQAELQEPDFLGTDDFETLLVAFGSTHGALAEAVALLNEAGGRYAALVFGDIWPLPQQRLLACAKQAKHIVNVEQNATGQLAALLRETALLRCGGSVLKYDGRQMSVDYIVDALTALQNAQNPAQTGGEPNG